MIGLRTRALFALLILLVGPAKADWDGTRWGMTPAEVAASGAPAFWPANESDRNRLSDGMVTVFEFHTTLYGQPADGFLRFRHDRLVSVELQASGGDAVRAIRDGMSLDYGVADSDDSRLSGLCMSDSRGWATAKGNVDAIIVAQQCPEGGASFAFVSFDDPRPPKQSQAEIEKDLEFSDAAQSAKTAVSKLRDKLRDPESLVLDEVAYRPGDGGWGHPAVCLRYHARNSAGGTDRGLVVYDTRDVDANPKAWKAHCVGAMMVIPTWVVTKK